MPSDGSEFLFEKTLWGIKWLDQKLGGGFWNWLQVVLMVSYVVLFMISVINFRISVIEGAGTVRDKCVRHLGFR